MGKWHEEMQNGGNELVECELHLFCLFQHSLPVLYERFGVACHEDFRRGGKKFS